jgi:hypothetical protein
MSRKMGCVPNFQFPISIFWPQAWGHTKKLPEGSLTQVVVYTQPGVSFVERAVREMAFEERFIA